jgi:hypothetical protein
MGKPQLMLINTYLNTSIKKDLNNIRTLLNGGNLRKLFFLNCLGNSQANTNKANEIDPNIIQKGLQSLDNLVLRGSYTLVLSNKTIEKIETIAKKAFKEIINQGLVNVTFLSEKL